MPRPSSADQQPRAELDAVVAAADAVEVLQRRQAEEMAAALRYRAETERAAREAGAAVRYIAEAARVTERIVYRDWQAIGYDYNAPRDAPRNL